MNLELAEFPFICKLLNKDHTHLVVTLTCSFCVNMSKYYTLWSLFAWSLLHLWYQLWYPILSWWHVAPYKTFSHVLCSFQSTVSRRSSMFQIKASEGASPVDANELFDDLKEKVEIQISILSHFVQISLLHRFLMIF